MFIFFAYLLTDICPPGDKIVGPLNLRAATSLFVGSLGVLKLQLRMHLIKIRCSLVNLSMVVWRFVYCLEVASIEAGFDKGACIGAVPQTNQTAKNT